MEKRQAFNPYLPSWEYIPDGEPHVFGDRVYVYGSHDKFNAPIFCVNDYVCWSAPVDDLSDWRCEGVIYRKNQDPKNKLGLRLLFAPDVCRGPDGRYYLYYAFDFMGIMGVAVCDTPAGAYQFLGHVRHPDGTVWGRKKGDQFPFDPGVLADDDGRIWLYSGFYPPAPALVTGFQKLRNDGGTVVELEKDMVTMKGGPRVIFPKQGPGSFPNHEFFEASSIRKDGDSYIFVYSSRHNHELCYAVSDRPDGGFTFGGTLVSLGDLFLDGRTEEKDGLNYLGNTHGGLLNLGADWYIFYHRQTNRPPFLLPAGLRGEAGAHPRRRLPAGGGDLLRAERRGAAGRGPVRGPDRLQFVEQGRRGAVRRPQPPQKAEGAPLFHPIRRPEGGVRPVHRQYAGRRGGGVQVFPHGNAGLHPGGNQRGGPGDHGGLRHAGLCPPLRGAENRPRNGPGAAAGHRARRAAAVLPLPRGGQREFSRLHPSDGIMGEAAQAVKNRRDSFEKLYQ